MNLKQAFRFCKKYFNFSDAELGQYLGISRPQVTKINSGYRVGLTACVLIRISQLLRISIDELLGNQFLPPSYHFSKHIYAVYTRAERAYPEFSIEMDDFLYIRPFVFDESKVGQLVLRWAPEGYLIERYAQPNSNIHYHVVGISRYLYKPIGDLTVQESWAAQEGVQKKGRGRPIKI